MKSVRKCLKIHVAGETVCLRLDIAAQLELSQQFDEDTIQTVLAAAADLPRRVALLDAALNWKGNENPVKDGRELHDLLVDEGYAGAGDFSKLALDIAAASGVLSEQQKCAALKCVQGAVDGTFEALNAEQEENPTQEA
jgi:hypothetical protein